MAIMLILIDADYEDNTDTKTSHIVHYYITNVSHNCTAMSIQPYSKFGFKIKPWQL